MTVEKLRFDLKEVPRYIDPEKFSNRMPINIMGGFFSEKRDTQKEPKQSAAKGYGIVPGARYGDAYVYSTCSGSDRQLAR